MSRDTKFKGRINLYYIDSCLSRHHSILKLDQFRFNLHSVVNSELWVVNGYAKDIFDNKEATN